MATITTDDVVAWAFCHDALCDGYLTVEVEAVREVDARSYIEKGADPKQGFVPPTAEDTHESLVFKNTEDRTCPYCSQPRSLSDRPRPQYANLSGQDQRSLLHLRDKESRLKEVEQNQKLDKAQKDVEIANLRAEIAEFKSLLREQAQRSEE